MERKARALERFNAQAGNCAQSVLAAFGPQLGLDETLCLRVAAGFGAGIARLGFTCGAAAGACMVLGLRHSHQTPEPARGRDEVYSRVQDFMDRFRTRFGHLDCAALTGCDLRTPEGRQSFHDRGLLTGLCAHLVAGAAEILEEMAAAVDAPPRT